MFVNIKAETGTKHFCNQNKKAKKDMCKQLLSITKYILTSICTPLREVISENSNKI